MSMPKTFFSTPLSGSDSLVKQRIQNLMDGPKKRPPAAVLVLAALAIALCGNLVSCQSANTPSVPDPNLVPLSSSASYTAPSGDRTLLAFCAGDRVELRESDGTVAASLPYDDALYGFPAVQPGPSGAPGIPAFFGQNGTLAWAVLNSGPAAGTSLVNVLLSRDSGQTWTRCPGQLALSQTVGAGFLTAEHGFVCSRYAVTTGPEIYETTDGGRTWALAEIPVPLELREQPEWRLTAASPLLDGDYAIFPVYAKNGERLDCACIYTPDSGWGWDTKQIVGMPDLPQTDLNRNGVPEDLYATVDIDIGFHHLTVVEAGQVIYTETFRSEPDRTLLLYRDGEGKDWLLRYTADYVYDAGTGNYSWELFCLDGRPSSGKGLSFNTHFGQPGEDFDPDAIAAFVEEVNGMLARSTPLISSNPYMWYSEFDRTLRESLWWMDQERRAFHRTGLSLLQDLRDYQAAMTAYLAGRPAVPYTGGDGAQGALRAFLNGEVTFYDLDIGRNIDFAHIREGFSNGLAPSVFTVLDMDGDGISELLFQSGDYRDWTLVLHWSGGELYGREFYIRSLGNLKADGTFSFSSSAFDSGVGRLRFNGEEYETVKAAQAEQAAKPDAEWYSLTEENFSALLP